MDRALDVSILCFIDSLIYAKLGSVHARSRGTETMREESSSKLPLGYTLDLVGDPHLVLHRDGEMVVTRFTHNVDPEEIRRAAEEERRERA